ncbi:MAG: hypothetical protein QNJ00_06150 [Woeseiaceae bacterium]|nr:hypothetical protein [Woeseiaceae bacterium]
MSESRLMRSALVAAVAIFAIMAVDSDAYARKELSSDKGVLKHVPASSPYVYASVTPLPRKVADKLEPQTDQMLRAYGAAVRDVARAEVAKGAADANAEDLAQASAMIDELVGLLSIEGLRNAGVARDSAVVIYGNGLLPVARIELSDPKLFDAAIVRMEKAAGNEMDTAKLGRDSYRYVDGDDLRIIIGIFDDDAVFAFAPSTFDDDDLKALVGMDLPKKNIADSGRLADIAKGYDMSGHAVGFIDTVQIASLVIDKPQDDLHEKYLEWAEFDNTGLTDVCREELHETASVVPKVVFGYRNVSTDGVNGALIVDVRNDIASGLASLTSVVPGLGLDPGGLVSFGMAVNLTSFRSFFESRLTALEDDPYECDLFAEFQAGLAGGRAMLEQPIPPFLYGLRGLNMVIDDMDPESIGADGRPQDMDVALLVAMDDAEAMYAMGSMMSPELAALNLRTDGEPVAIDLPQAEGNPMYEEGAYAAMVENAIAVSVGNDAEARLGRVLELDSVDPSPVMSITFDAGTYYDLMGESMGKGDGDPEEQITEQSRKALAEAFQSVGKLYDRMMFDLRFTQRGVEVESRMTFKD